MSIPNIFKAYDVRGVYPDELNEEMVEKIARAFVFLRKDELKKNGLKVVVGRDMRLSSPSLRNAVIRGLTDQGADVIDVGLVSAPTFYFAICRLKADGGLMVSASHNPKEYNGIKITRENAKPLGAGNGMEEIKQMTEAGGFSEPEKKGEVELREGVLDEQVKYEEQGIDLKQIRKFKIVADPANAMGAQYLEALFKDLPQLELFKMNFELDGTFPAHQADPFQDKNVADLKKKVLAEKADLGIATDGDGDRIFFIDNEGELLEPAILRGIMAKIFLREFPGATICYDIRPGKITEDMILENGGVPSVTRVGHSLIKKQMLEVGAVFGGESSGHFFVKFPHGVYEAPMLVVLKLLLELTETDKNLADYARPLRKYFHSGEINFKVEDKAGVLARVSEKYSDAELNELDGLTFTYPNYWFNVRLSNTESLVRLNLEATSKELMEEKTKEVSGIINL
ncbi:MAG: phosphomannomutase/phosphoglucomutase [Candidatus Magasanikbacteria bacterium]|nr:phosphomannomutase/phosphoglucomutase [Candidatus Magasanikbacteria bacterium]